MSENFYQPTSNHSPKDIIQQDQAINGKKTVELYSNSVLQNSKQHKVMKYCPTTGDYTLVSMYFLQHIIKHISR